MAFYALSSRISKHVHKSVYQGKCALNCSTLLQQLIKHNNTMENGMKSTAHVQETNAKPLHNKNQCYQVLNAF